MKLTLKKSTLLMALGTAFVLPQAQAEENLWIYATGTDTRPKGSTELKISDVMREGKNAGDYTFHDIRPEIEYGITDRLTVGASVLIFDHDYNVGSEAEGGPCPMCDAGDGTGKFNDTQYGGYEIEAKYNILSPYKDPFGLSLGLAYERRNRYRLDGAKIHQYSIVPKLFLQKNFLDDTLVFAFTGKMEFEKRTSPGVKEDEIAFDLALGGSYRVAPKWFVGLEYRYQSDYLCPEVDGECDDEDNVGLEKSRLSLTDLKIGSRHQYGSYFGPTVHYAEKEWWATAGLLFQVKGGGSPYADVRNGRNWDEHERYHLGLALGYEF